MRNILLLGSGTSVPPLVKSFTDQGHKLTIASRNLSTAKVLSASSPEHEAVELNIDDSPDALKRLDELVAAADNVISFTSGACLPAIATACLKHRKDLVTSSHIGYFGATAESREVWDKQAKEAGIAIVTEAGSDPGFGRMLGKRIIDRVRGEGGEIVDLKYHVAAIPVQADVNPFSYKFSWAPKKAIFSALNMKDGAGNHYENFKEVFLPAAEVYLNTRLENIPGVGAFETHPNADSGAHLYQVPYGLEKARTFYQGTLRHFGWGTALQGLIDLGFDDGTRRVDLLGKSYLALLCQRLGCHADEALDVVTKCLNLHRSNETILRYEWLGLFDDRQTYQAANPSYCDAVSELFVDRLGTVTLESTEADQMIFYYDIIAKYPEGKRRIESVTNPRRLPGRFSVCTELTSLTAAMCSRYLFEGVLELTGLHQALNREFYDLVLPEHEQNGVTTTEQEARL